MKDIFRRQKISQDYEWDEVIELIRIEEKMNSGLSLSSVEVEHLKRMGKEIVQELI